MECDSYYMETFIQDPSQFLAEELERRIKKNPSYSLRSFAQVLQLSPGELSEIIRGKRRLSLKGAFKVVKALGLQTAEAEKFLNLVQYTEAARAGMPLPKGKLVAHSLSADFFHLVSDWYCFAILSLAETKDFRFDIGVIAKQFKISITEAKLALDRLERVGLLKRVNGQLQVVSDFVVSPDDIASEAVKRCHEQLLDKAKDALQTQSIDEREMGGITFAVNPKRLPELKKDLKKFLDDWAEKVSALDPRSKTEVYQLETALFRLSKKGDRL